MNSQNTQKNRLERVAEIDLMRGIAIVLMIVYHSFFDLNYFGFLKINLFDIEWVLFQRIIATLFLSIVGISLVLSERKNKEGYKRHAKRGLKLAIVAGLITITTWIYPHDGFIMFGIIHLVALATFVGPLFFRFDSWNIAIGLAVILAGFYITDFMIDSPYLVWLGIIYPSYAPLDHFPLFPWFGIVLIGIFLGQKFYSEGETRIRIKSKIIENLAFLGRNALLIYIIHQPIILGLLMAYGAFIVN